MSHDAPAAPSWRASRRLLPGMLVGTVLEWYDLFIYAQAAALVLGPLFFPQVSETAGTLAAFATFGVGYLARPLGAIIFGHIGDRYGRKRALIATLILMGVATTAIGLLPTYAAAGLAAPVLLTVLRLAQGLGAGAEYAGAFVMVAELAPRNRRGLWTSIPGTGIYGGVLLSAAVAAVVFTLPEAALYSWGWRVPFLVSFLLIGVGMYLRLRITETPVFTELAQRKAVRKLPVLTVLKEMPLRLFLAVLLTTPIAFNAYVALTYSITFSVEQGLSDTDALIGILLGSAVALVSVPTAGWASDRFGRRPVYLTLAALTAVVAIPYFWLLSTGQPPATWAAQALLMGPVAFAVTGAQAAFLAELFDSRYRYSGVALSRELSTAALTAPAPVIAISLTAAAGGAPWLTAGLMALVGVVCFVAVLALPETAGIDLSPANRADVESAESTA